MTGRTTVVYGLLAGLCIATVLGCDPATVRNDTTAVAVDSAITKPEDAGVAMKRPEYAGRGKADYCSFKKTEPEDWCPGFFNLDLSTSDTEVLQKVAKQLAQFDLSNPWTASSYPISHNGPTLGAPKSKYTVQALKQGRRIPFEDLGTNDFIVVARFVAVNSTPVDGRYGIRGDVQSLSENFYLVVSNFDKNPHDSTDKKRSRRMADWAVYGIRTDPATGVKTAEKMSSKAGGFRYCEMRHTPVEQRDGAAFYTCESAHGIVAISKTLGDSATQSMLRTLQSRFLTDEKSFADSAKIRQTVGRMVDEAMGRFPALTQIDRQRLVGFFTQLIPELPENPAWMHCGAGCCTADDF